MPQQWGSLVIVPAENSDCTLQLTGLNKYMDTTAIICRRNSLSFLKLQTEKNQSFKLLLKTEEQITSAKAGNHPHWICPGFH